MGHSCANSAVRSVAWTDRCSCVDGRREVGATRHLKGRRWTQAIHDPQPLPPNRSLCRYSARKPEAEGPPQNRPQKSVPSEGSPCGSQPHRTAQRLARQYAPATEHRTQWTEVPRSCPAKKTEHPDSVTLEEGAIQACPLARHQPGASTPKGGPASVDDGDASLLGGPLQPWIGF